MFYKKCSMSLENIVGKVENFSKYPLPLKKSKKSFQGGGVFRGKGTDTFRPTNDVIHSSINKPAITFCYFCKDTEPFENFQLISKPKPRVVELFRYSIVNTFCTYILLCWVYSSEYFGKGC